MKHLIWIKNIKREDWIMTFKILDKKYKEEIDYRYYYFEQIKNMIWEEIYTNWKEYYIIKK